MKKITSGFVNQKIIIYTYADVDDGSGGTIPGKVVYWETAAEVTPLKANRSLQANQEELKPVNIFKFRHRKDKFLTNDMFIEWRGVLYTMQLPEIDYVYKTYIEIQAKATDLPKR